MALSTLLRKLSHALRPKPPAPPVTKREDERREAAMSICQQPQRSPVRDAGDGERGVRGGDQNRM